MPTATSGPCAAALHPELYTRQNVLDQLSLYARYGVTTVVSLGDDREEGFRVRDEHDTPSLDRSRLYVAARWWTRRRRRRRGRMAALAERKVDWVKIPVNDTLGATPKMAPAVYQAVIAEAHSEACVWRPTSSISRTQGLLAAGVDFIAAGVRDRPWTRSRDCAREAGRCSAALMREVSAFGIPTSRRSSRIPSS